MNKDDLVSYLQARDNHGLCIFFQVLESRHPKRGMSLLLQLLYQLNLLDSARDFYNLGDDVFFPHEIGEFKALFADFGINSDRNTLCAIM